MVLSQYLWTELMQIQYSFSWSRLQNWKECVCTVHTGKKTVYLLLLLPHTVKYFSIMVSVLQSVLQPSKIKIQEQRGKLIITEKDMFPVCHDNHSMNCVPPSPSPNWDKKCSKSKWTFQGYALKAALCLFNFILLKPKYQYQMYLFLGKIHT